MFDNDFRLCYNYVITTEVEVMLEQENGDAESVLIPRDVLSRLVEKGVGPEDLEMTLGPLWKEIHDLKKIKRGKQPDVVLYSGTEMLKAVELAYRMGRSVATVKELAPIMRRLLKLKGNQPRKPRKAVKA